MATKQEIYEFLDTDGDLYSKMLLDLTVSITSDGLQFCFKDDLTDEEYEKFKENLAKAISDITSFSVKTEKGEKVNANEFNKKFDLIAPYLDIKKLYLFYSNYFKHNLKADSFINTESDDIYSNIKLNGEKSKVYKFLLNKMSEKKIGQNGDNTKFLFLSNRNFFLFLSNDKMLKYSENSKRIIEKIGRNFSVDDIGECISDIYVKRIYNEFSNSKFNKSEFEKIKETLCNEKSALSLFDESLLEKKYLGGYLLNKLDEIEPENYKSIRDELKDLTQAYDEIQTIEKKISEQNQNRKDKVDIKDIAEYADIIYGEHIDSLIKRKDEFYNEIFLTKDPSVIKIRDDLINKKIIKENDAELFLKMLYTNSKINKEELTGIVNNLKAKGLDIDEKCFDYNITKHANAFMKNHAEDINKIMEKSNDKKSIITLKSDEQEEIDEVDEKYYKKLYDENIKNSDKNASEELAEEFALEVANINEDLLYNNYEGVKYLYKNGYMDYKTVVDFLDANNIDPRDKKHPIKQLKNDDIEIRKEDLRDFSNAEDINSQFELYLSTKGKKGISGENFIDMYINGDITDENFKEFIKMAKEKNVLEKIFSANKINEYLMDAEQNGEKKEIGKYNLYRKCFYTYANKDEQKKFENDLKTKSRNINFSNKDNCILEYKLHVITAKYIDNYYSKLEEKMKDNKSKSAISQLDEIDEFLVEMIKIQGILSDDDVNTIFCDGTMDTDIKKKRLAEILSEHKDITHQQKMSLIFKIVPPENEYFNEYLKVDSYTPKHDIDVNRVTGNGKSSGGIQQEREIRERIKVFEFLNDLGKLNSSNPSLNDGIITEIYGDILACEIPSQNKVIIEQCQYSPSNNVMNLTNKASYIMTKEYYDSLRNGQPAKYEKGNPVSLFYKDSNNNERIDWPVLCSLKDRKDVKRSIHNYKAHSWERSLLKNMGYSEKDAEKNIEEYYRNIAGVDGRTEI